VSSRLLLENGFSSHVVSNMTLGQPGIEKPYGTPEWYATASRTDILLATTWASTPTFGHTYPTRYAISSSASYVTGSHSFKTGVQWHWGYYKQSTDANADLQQRYRNGVPDSVVVRNTPTYSTMRLNADLGVYVQDTWTLGRMTLSPGVRFQYFNSSNEAIEIRAGRFVEHRVFAEMPDTPDWFNVSPRFGFASDLTGDGRTALKASVGKYFRQWTHGFASRYAVSAAQTDIRNWRDCDFIPGTSTCSARALPTNGDDIAQDNEIGPSNNRRFGQAPARRADPNIKREYDMQYSVSVDREVLTGLSVTGAATTTSSPDGRPQGGRSTTRKWCPRRKTRTQARPSMYVHTFTERGTCSHRATAPLRACTIWVSTTPA
jgi:hypothetical protein